MELVITADYEGLSREAARFVARQVLLKEDLVLGLPTGETPRGMYRELVRMGKEGLFNPSKIIAFNLDEYVGLPPSHPQSFHHYMEVHLFGPLAFPPERIHIPNGVADDLAKECRRYEAEIARHGGLDLLVLGLGLNGHIGFNEPGSDWATETRVVTLSEETRQREIRRFGGLDLVPTRAITMGIKTIMRAKRILLLASGEEKAEIVKKALTGPVVKEVPASILQLHPDATVILDLAAASKIRNLDLNSSRVEGASAVRPRPLG